MGWESGCFSKGCGNVVHFIHLNQFTMIMVVTIPINQYFGIVQPASSIYLKRSKIHKELRNRYEDDMSQQTNDRKNE